MLKESERHSTDGGMEDKVAMNTIDARMVQKMFLAGAETLAANKEQINDLNVFPVPDGDTGINMTMTITSAADEVRLISEPTMSNLASAISQGSLRGARGNSGVILSQLFRGFCKEIQEHDVLDVKIISTAAQKATETAYKAVMKPKEGTILTVARAVAERAMHEVNNTEDIEEALKSIIEHGDDVLSKTPEMLPVLKEAGVVDSGGQGLMCVLHGFYDALTGKITEFNISDKPAPSVVKKAGIGSAYDNVEITFGYCTEFIIKTDNEFTEKDEEEFKAYLSSMGDSIVCVALDNIVKVHVHTNHPGEVFEEGLKYGQLTRMKVDNMREEHENNLIGQDLVDKAVEEEKKAIPLKETGVLAVVPGGGLREIFVGIGADDVIEGGQTMNPSTDDILKSVEKLNAKTVYVLPNNKNIILAANQAADLCEDKNVVVIPTTTIPQGISALVAYDPTAGEDSNKEHMNEAIGAVKSGQVTYAVRDTQICGKEVNKGDYIALDDNGLSSVAQDIDTAVINMIESMVDDESELVSVYYGEDIEEEQAEELQEQIEEKFPEIEVEIEFGGQPVYYYIVSVE